jgi:hypothetical protein
LPGLVGEIVCQARRGRGWHLLRILPNAKQKDMQFLCMPAQCYPAAAPEFRLPDR